MKKGPKIIQISGLQGIFFIAFVTVCLVAGFIIFPAKVAMSAWNYIASTYFIVPAINLIQGLMLWAIVALSTYLLVRKKDIISFKQPMELSEAEMSVLMERIKMQKQAQKLRTMIVKAREDFETIKSDENVNKSEENKQASNNINEKQL